MKSVVKKSDGCEPGPNQDAEDCRIRIANNCQAHLSSRIVAGEDPASGDSSQARSAAVTLRRSGESGSAKARYSEASQFDTCQWERIFNSIGSGIRIIDRTHHIMHVNDAFCRLAGVTREETVGRFCYECFPNAACRTDDCVLERLARGERLVDCETEIVQDCGEGRACKISTAPLNADNGEWIGVIEVFQDITERRQAEIALRKSEELHRITLVNISDAVFITDDDGLFTFICPNSDVIFGYSSEEIAELGQIRNLLGSDLFNKVKPDELSELQNSEVIINDKVGEQHVLLVNVKRVSIQGGTVLYTCRDITARKQAEEELRLHRDHLEELVAQRTGELSAANESLMEGQLALEIKNTTLSGVLEQVEVEKRHIRDLMQANIERMVLPLIGTLMDRIDPAYRNLATLLESCLKDIATPFLLRLESGQRKLSPSEIEICNMIKNGFDSKQIASLRNVSILTIVDQRKTIRKKLGIANKAVNLVTHLKQLDQN